MFDDASGVKLTQWSIRRDRPRSYPPEHERITPAMVVALIALFVSLTGRSGGQLLRFEQADQGRHHPSPRCPAARAALRGAKAHKACGAIPARRAFKAILATRTRSHATCGSFRRDGKAQRDRRDQPRAGRYAAYSRCGGDFRYSSVQLPGMRPSHYLREDGAPVAKLGLRSSPLRIDEELPLHRRATFALQMRCSSPRRRDPRPARRLPVDAAPRSRAVGTAEAVGRLTWPNRKRPAKRFWGRGRIDLRPPWYEPVRGVSPDPSSRAATHSADSGRPLPSCPTPRQRTPELPSIVSC